MVVVFHGVEKDPYCILYMGSCNAMQWNAKCNARFCFDLRLKIYGFNENREKSYFPLDDWNIWMKFQSIFSLLKRENNIEKL